ncbi:DUF397 domain-containing protein (plasmid) [Actinomadura sp. ATCC 31491]|uniref:DUF397 domain-containing protein n=1 Tax=Actinomadura luzonensis TaxID=2805427 RepID=A0ABT0GBM4_9ACTN|nr:DUF397 domain-containing protein [Actinomadura luzonensis]MCK2222019.1 DUF397 domain-containing protein [Actinomadura luzonensis]
MDLADVRWRKSSRSGNGANCVEVAAVEGRRASLATSKTSDRLYLVRDSKDPDGPVLAFTPEEWDAFRQGLKDGEFDDLD